MRLSKLTLVLATTVALALGLQAAEAKKKVKPYTLEVCAVSGEKLGGMGKAYTFNYEDREIKLCCESCLKDFKKEPAKYIKKIEEAEKKAKSKKS